MRDLSNLAAGIGRSAMALGTFGLSELKFKMDRDKEEQRRRRNIQLGNILSGQGGDRDQQLQQLAQIGTPEALRVLSQLSPMLQEPEAPITPMSPEGKLQADIARGFVPQNYGAALLQKKIEPRQPLVQITDKSETKGQEALSKKAAENIIKIQDAGSYASDVMFNADRLQEAVNRGSVGLLAEPKAFLTQLTQAIGLDVSEQDLARAADVTAANRILGDKTLQKLEGLKGSTSNRDLDFARGITGRLSQGKGSVQELVDLMRASAIKSQQLAEMANQADLEDMPVKKMNIMLNRQKNKIKLKDIFDQVVADRRANEPQQITQTPQEAPNLQNISTQELLQMLEAAQ
jgi:hypothetical protein